jgi:hypothetical protein
MCSGGSGQIESHSEEVKTLEAALVYMSNKAGQQGQAWLLRWWPNMAIKKRKQAGEHT